MYDHHSAEHSRPFSAHARGILIGLCALPVLAILISVAWNLFAPELLGLEPLRIKHAIGMVLLVAVATHAWRMPHSYRKRRARVAENGALG